MPNVRAIPPIARASQAEEQAPTPPESRFDVRDGVGVAGLAALVWGVWQIYPPAGWIVLGLALLVIAWRV